MMVPEILSVIIGIAASATAWGARGLWETKQEIGRERFRAELSVKMQEFVKVELAESSQYVQATLDPLKEAVKEVKFSFKEIQEDLAEIRDSIKNIRSRVSDMEFRQQATLEVWDSELSAVLTAATGNPVSVALFRNACNIKDQTPPRNTEKDSQESP
jgi:septal ring factor EnvC (AmiA/AmiB activator)